MALNWSFSGDKCFRRCQRQYYFRHIAACHNSKDPLRREAFILKQLKTLELWRGLLVHQGIERFLIPRLGDGQQINWDRAVRGTKALASAQLQFSADGRYRINGNSKTKHPDEYCALMPHELGRAISDDEMRAVEETIEQSFDSLAGMAELLQHLKGRNRYWPELPVRIEYDGAPIEVRLDLLFFRGYGKPTIIDWKVYESTGGTDAHFQAALYAWVMCRHDKWSVSRAEDVELIEVRLLEPQVIRHRCTEEVFEELEDRMYRSLHEIRSLCGPGTFSAQDPNDYAYANNPNSCNYCPFRAICKVGEKWGRMF